MTTITTLRHARAALIGAQFVMDPSVHKLQLGSNAQAIAAIAAEIARLEARKPVAWINQHDVLMSPDELQYTDLKANRMRPLYSDDGDTA